MNNLPSKINKIEVNDFYKDNNGKVYVSSLYVAKITKKETKIVMRDIRSIIDSDKNFTEYNFVLSEYKDNSGKMNNFYWMTEDGCSVLIGGYSVEHRIKIQKELRAYKDGDKTLLPEDHIKAVEMYLEQLKENEAKRKHIEKLNPFVIFVRDFVKSSKIEDNELMLAQVSKILTGILKDSISPTKFREILREFDMLCKKSDEPRQWTVNKGLMKLKYHKQTPLVLPKGLIYIGAKMVKAGYSKYDIDDEVQNIISDLENGTFDITKYEEDK